MQHAGRHGAELVANSLYRIRKMEAEREHKWVGPGVGFYNLTVHF